MAKVNDEAMNFLLSRRSLSPKMLSTPVPSREDLEPILTAALRVPDHGGIQPWRLLVLENKAMTRLSEALPKYGVEAGIDPQKVEKTTQAFAGSPLAIAAILSPQEGRIPLWEQSLSAGALCLGLVNAALASGWGAGWVTGWASENRGFLEGELGLAKTESLAGFVHIGTPKQPPTERPRPDIVGKVTWLSN